jgi:hypothetical protein
MSSALYDLNVSRLKRINKIKFLNDFEFIFRLTIHSHPGFASQLHSSSLAQDLFQRQSNFLGEKLINL